MLLPVTTHITFITTQLFLPVTVLLPKKNITCCCFYFDYYLFLHVILPVSRLLLRILLLITTRLLLPATVLLPKTYITPCYFYFDYYLLLDVLLPISTNITSHHYSAITTCYCSLLHPEVLFYPLLGHYYLLLRLLVLHHPISLLRGLLLRHYYLLIRDDPLLRDVVT